MSIGNVLSIASPEQLGRARFEYLAAELVRQNEELLEDNRQMRAAIALWAKAAVNTCLKCSYRAAAEETGAGRTNGHHNDLVQIGSSLLQSLGR